MGVSSLESALGRLRCRHPRGTWPAKGARRSRISNSSFSLNDEISIRVSSRRTDEARESERRAFTEARAYGEG